MNKMTNEFENNFAREYLTTSTIEIEGLKSINDKLSVVKSADTNDVRLYIESYKLFGFIEEEAIKFQFSQSVSRIVYRRIGKIIHELVYEAFKFSNKYDCRKNSKFEDLLTDDNMSDDVKAYSAKEAGDVILFDKKYSYEIKWSFATTAGNELKMILSKPSICNSIKYKPVLLIFSEPVPKQAKKSYKRLKNEFGKYGSVYEKSEAWKHIEEMTGIDLRGIFENHLRSVVKNEHVKMLLKEIHEKTKIS
ncbi:ApaLI family restriction endonuclease [Desulfococcaceae bacterium HSG8]|nr:ApaLI family restriction endonuclease [Desulfococcaceae bacterium HSG8]